MRVEEPGPEDVGVAPRVVEAVGVQQAEAFRGHRPAQVRQGEVVERREQHPVEQPRLLHDPQGVVLHPGVQLDAVLQFEVDAQPGGFEQFEDLSEGGDLHLPVPDETVAVVAQPQLLQGQVGHPAEPVRGAVDGFVVDDDELPVDGALHVELDAVRTHLDRLLDGGNGVLGGVCRCSTMSPDRCHDYPPRPMICPLTRVFGRITGRVFPSRLVDPTRGSSSSKLVEPTRESSPLTLVEPTRGRQRAGRVDTKTTLPGNPRTGLPPIRRMVSTRVARPSRPGSTSFRKGRSRPDSTSLFGLHSFMTKAVLGTP